MHQLAVCGVSPRVGSCNFRQKESGPQLGFGQFSTSSSAAWDLEHRIILHDLISGSVITPATGAPQHRTPTPIDAWSGTVMMDTMCREHSANGRGPTTILSCGPFARATYRWPPGISRRGSAGAFALELHWKTCHTNVPLISDLLISDGYDWSGVIAKLFAKSMRSTRKAG
jgi:hypothetical protein